MVMERERASNSKDKLNTVAEGQGPVDGVIEETAEVEEPAAPSTVDPSLSR